MIDSKQPLAESLVEFLKENQKTVSHVLRLSSIEQEPAPLKRQQEPAAAKTASADGLFEFLRENQKTVSHVLKLSMENEPATQYKQQMMQATGGVTVSEVLEKMSELIELNKVTLQTIDLLDKRVKRLHTFVSSQLAKPTLPEQSSQPAQEEGEKVEYLNE